MDVIVKSTTASKYSEEIIIGKHVLTADEPASVGGADLGPGPYELLLASLGACKAMTIRMYADLKKIALTHVEVKLSHNKDYVKDCENCEKSSSKIDVIDVQISLQGDLTDEERQKLLTIANNCPVHRTLTSTIKINSSLTK